MSLLLTTRPRCLLGVFPFALIHVISIGQKSGLTLMNLAVVCVSSNTFMTTPVKQIPTHFVPKVLGRLLPQLQLFRHDNLPTRKRNACKQLSRVNSFCQSYREAVFAKKRNEFPSKHTFETSQPRVLSLSFDKK